jgi:hypothetical protein
MSGSNQYKKNMKFRRLVVIKNSKGERRIFVIRKITKIYPTIVPKKEKKKTWECLMKFFKKNIKFFKKNIKSILKPSGYKPKIRRKVTFNI